MQNNFFSYNDKFYHQIRGGAMGSPLTLTMANCYMYFFEQPIFRQVKNSNGLYFRYIDDIYLMINWPDRHLSKQIERWNGFDNNIKLHAQIGKVANFLDLHISNANGKLVTKVYHKPSYEPYYLPFNSVHPMHMKKNIPLAMLIRAIRYCSSFHLFIQEKESLKMTLMLNKYPNEFIEKQFSHVFLKFQINEQLSNHNYCRIRERIIAQPNQEKTPVDYDKNIFVHFTFCSTMRSFPIHFLNLWNKYFSDSPIRDTIPIIGSRNVDNLQLQLTNPSTIRPRTN